jgi:hypothetical protein
VTFDEAVSRAVVAIKRPGPVEWNVVGWTFRRELYPRIRLAAGHLVSAPVSLTAEDLAASDWELVES